MNTHLIKIIFTSCAFALAGCEKKAEEQQVDYPERTHNGEKAKLVLTQHQLEHIEFAVEAAEIKTVTAPLSLPGRVALNERTTAHLTARVMGRVEKVHRVVGDRMKKGEALVELFSQEFLATQSEFVQAEERLKRMTAEQAEYGTTKAIYESSRNKLQIVGLTNEEIDQLADTHTPLALLPVRAPFDGTLLSGEVRLGEFVEVGREFFTLANLQKLWVIADVFEHDLPLIHEGLAGEVMVTPYPTEKFPAMLTTIYDMVDEKSRTVKTRFEVHNRAGKLKPEMFATVNVEAKFGSSSLKISSLAVMSNNNEAFVFVALNDTTFEQRAIKIGFETKAYTEVLEGLTPGERVVTKGTFYLKSEMAKETFVEEE
ncbi:MAG: efflux RND transporter periplasmic adaptor subunit [candidate division KSB1 bacterium]